MYPSSTKFRAGKGRINQTLKEALTELTLESGEGWVGLLPFALFRTQCTPLRKSLTSFGILWGRPPPILPLVGLELATEISKLSTTLVHTESTDDAGGHGLLH